MYIIVFFVCAITSYLLGSINFAIIISKLIKNKDIRDYGSGNAGMTNVIRNFGIIPGVITFFGDFIKSSVSVILGTYLFPQLFGFMTNTVYFGYICAFFCTIGHMFPLFFGFKGGKGIVTTFGAVMMLDWRVGVAALVLFTVLFAVTKIISFCSLTCAVIFPIMIALVSSADNNEIKMIVFKTAVCSFIAIFDIVKHKDNIKRLINGEEKKLTFGKD